MTKINKLLGVINSWIDSTICQIALVVMFFVKLIPLRMIQTFASPIYTPFRYLILLIDLFVVLCFVFKIIKEPEIVFKLMIPVVLYCGITIISTLVVSKGSFSKAVYEMFQYSSCITMFFCFKKETIKNSIIIYILFGFLSALLLGNLIFFLIHQKGMIINGRTYYLFDLQNDTPNFIFSYGFFILVIGHYKEKLLIPAFIIYLSCLLQVIFYDYSTGRLGAIMLVVLSFFFVFDKDVILKRIPVFLYWIIPLGLFLFICVFRFHYYFKWLIVDILHEDLTFHTRLYAWDYGLKAISKSPFFGYGYDKASYHYNIINRLTDHYSHSHSEYLEVILRSGIIGFTMFATPFSLLFKRANKKLMGNNILIRIFTLCIFVFFIMGIDETVICPAIIMFLSLGLYYSYHINKNENVGTADVEEKQKNSEGKICE